MWSKKEYQIDGTRFSTLDGFFEEIGRVLIPGASWGRNLDAFNDVLRGGFGTPASGFVLRWQNSRVSRANLGYAETVRELETRLDRCNSANRPFIAIELERAKSGLGPTVFDWLVEIIQRHSSSETQSDSSVELILA